MTILPDLSNPSQPPSRQLHVLVACEFSGTVRDAFTALGHRAVSCDLLPSETLGEHIQGDIREVLSGNVSEWDLLISHPPCTHLSVSGARWFKDKRDEQAAVLDLVRFLLSTPIAHTALENPVSIISSRIRKPDQITQPWLYGHGETKATCLWLKNLPLLAPTNIIRGPKLNRIHTMAPSDHRSTDRSRTYAGIAAAMADQWSRYIITSKERGETFK